MLIIALTSCLLPRHLFMLGELLTNTYTGFHYVRKFPWKESLDDVSHVGNLCSFKL